MAKRDLMQLAACSHGGVPLAEAFICRPVAQPSDAVTREVRAQITERARSEAR